MTAQPKWKIILVHVTTSAIVHGCAEDPYNCPIAIAVQKNLKHPYYVSVVSGEEIVVRNTHTAAQIKCSALSQYMDAIGTFIYTFDAYEDSEPFSFEMQLPEEVVVEAGYE